MQTARSLLNVEVGDVQQNHMVGALGAQRVGAVEAANECTWVVRAGERSAAPIVQVAVCNSKEVKIWLCYMDLSESY